MNESITSEHPHRPSALSAFFRGGMSGLFSGIVMAVVVSALLPIMAGAVGAGYLAAAGAAFMTTGLFMAACATLFGGIMATKRAVFDTPTTTPQYSNTMVPVPVPTMSGPAMVPMMTYADAPEQAPTKSWVADTGRSEGSQSRIQQILADGSMSDKDRASAILANRDAVEQQASRG